MDDKAPPAPVSSEPPVSPPRADASLGAGGGGNDPAEEGDRLKERKAIKATHNFDIQTGGKYCLVDASWWETWKSWVAFDDEGDEGGPPRGPRPGIIDNSSLLVEGSTARLRLGLREGLDYEIILLAEWELFEKWYAPAPKLKPVDYAAAAAAPASECGGGGGPTTCGPIVLRRGVKEGGYSSRRSVVELYGLNIKVYLSTERVVEAGAEAPAGRELNVSKAQTIRELKETVMKECGIVGQDVRLWDYFQRKPYALLDVPSKTLGEVQIMNDQDILVELPDEAGAFKLKKAATSTYSSYGNRGGDGDMENVVTDASRPVALGVVGLQNLGNTCFMNSTLQCLSNTLPLREYFSTGAFHGDVNRGNPLGHEGKLAESFGDLMGLMWSEKEAVTTVAPRGFKYQMGRFAPQFQGYQQHDSSELMSFLLDGMHEDLNRVLSKPYTEVIENDGMKPDEEMAKLFLDNHKKRNDSFIHDLFRGQFKSTLVCPDCGNVSVTFDPYTVVSLPLTTVAQERMKFYKVVVFAKAGDTRGRKRSVVRVGVTKGKKSGALRAAVAEEMGIPVERLVLAQLQGGYVFKTFGEDDDLEYISSYSTVMASEVEQADRFQWVEKPAYSYTYYSKTPAVTLPDSPLAAVVVYFRRAKQSSYTSAYYTSRPLMELYGEPLFLNHPKVTTPKELYEAVGAALSPGGLGPGHFKLYVSHNIYGTNVDTTAVPGDSEEAVRGQGGEGMKAKLNLVLEFEPTAAESLSTHMLDGIPGIGAKASDGGGAGGAAAAEEDEAVGGSGELQLSGCFDLFSTPEKLSPEEAWYCGKCKNHVEATKTMELWSTPDVLVLHLKRFSFNRWSRDKLETEVNFPLDGLDLSEWTKGPYAKGDAVYDCVSVSNHMGSLGGGHYTASGRGGDGKWYKFNDSGTAEMRPSQVNTGDVYLLFYVRRGKSWVPSSGESGGGSDDGASSSPGSGGGDGGSGS